MQDRSANSDSHGEVQGGNLGVSSRTPRIIWDHAWMSANWSAKQDEEIADLLGVSRDAVKGYRLRKGWKRQTQRRHGGSQIKIVQAAIDMALVRGIELNIKRVLVGTKYQMYVTAVFPCADGRVFTHRPKMVVGITALPRMFTEVIEEFNKHRRRGC